MTVTETVKETVKGALSPSDEPRKSEPMWTQYHSMNNGEAQEPIADWIYPLFIAARATREQMSEAKLPLAYRDSCAHLLIPLNRCRFEEYYMPWKCVVCSLPPLRAAGRD